MRNIGTDNIVEFVRGMLNRPMMYCQSTESLEMALLTAMTCWAYASGADSDERVRNLWRREIHRLHGNTGSRAVTLSDLPTCGKAMHMDAVTVPMRRIWLALTEPITAIGNVEL